MQKWGIREHLNDGKKLLDAIIQSEEYTEYILDRRLGCRQLGMNLPARTTAKRISERYSGPRRDMHNAMIWSPYFERDYIRGMATDKIPPQKLANAAFASRLARLLGQAAAPNMIVGRCDHAGPRRVRRRRRGPDRNDAGLPVEIVVADQMGTFADYRTDLEHFAAEYAEPVNRRLAAVGRSRGVRRACTSTPLSSASRGFNWSIGSGSGPSTRSSSIARATRRAVSPIAGNACWTACSGPCRRTWAI